MVDREPEPVRRPEPSPDDPSDPGRDGLGRASSEADGLRVFDGPGHDVLDPPRSRRLGVVTFVLAVVLLALDGVALGLLAADAVSPAAVLALVTLLASVVVGVIGLMAAVLRRGRWWGVAAVVLSSLSNPFVLVWLIGRFVSTV
ncbi:hypothetical protein IFT36_04630 [Frigoribacterium sp. CFBP 13605]|uniref:hypothetical protein n=1 Tax=Frigoribacterium sp. CFBP 13605 TaxID=2774034 RepID=UPI001905F8E4|nr:hypothetical protein [Frigoribacterium sp. CFBP 13605]MBD8139831.1 hypothetical protein [Frigoribacterium sp. CFBP 13605]